ncbi:hypothetical protein PHSY_004697 [Pseudozyma hubeiensis SY62]|uniref:Velvet domain-containing protein n=1 Tax=Pseudozyma hubeiensis (strain SY62) TaxID=1305764 RepID=R9P6T0_PSEHS|nr:hypothetical protein PHSY_004697 [Pseudozyma hubeiensis SY62]GAC97113.1 hypothetical protein PHSY_004697 [Pseudozyma hubeiensis SY62]
MSRSDTDGREVGSGAGPSHHSEHPSQRRERPEYGYAAADESRRPRTAQEVSSSDYYDQRSAYDAYTRDTDRSSYARANGLTSDQESSYQRELELMKAREEQERSYGGASGSRSNRPPETDYRYGGLPATRGYADEFGPRATTSTERPSLQGFSRVEDGKRYRLVVVQHPSRARMCGFGDKDRRPLSPTLIVKLVITDEATGEEISPSEVNTSLFLLATDLCHPDDLMLAPRNILVHHHASSLSAHSTQHGGPGGYATDEFGQRAGPSLGAYAADGAGPSEDGYRSGSGPPGAAASSSTSTMTPYERSPQASMQFGGTFAQQSQAESYTRNLVGAAVASASVLKDEQDKWCTFFVFQDISVRTEGVYRIKLTFVNLEVSGRVGTGVAEALSETYTEPFTVYSPRRFPGMLDPTPLSRKLASQGIKIPVRNDKKKQRRRNDDGGDGDDGGMDYDGGSGGDDDDD